ncbi:MAG: hypothetical protein AB8B73_14095 [Ekhidna sp.]
MTATLERPTTTLHASSNIDVSMNSQYKGNCMYFQFKGTFDKSASESATKIWKDEFEKNPFKQYKHIWDCTQMKDFHFDAKKAWTDTLAKYEPRIDVIYVVSESIVIRGAARLMTKLSKYDLKIFKSISEMYHYDQATEDYTNLF